MPKPARISGPIGSTARSRTSSTSRTKWLAALQAAETTRSAYRPTTDLTAYDLYLRAYAMFRSSARQIPEALRLTEQAIARDPRYGPALAWAAVCCHRLIGDDRSEDAAKDRRKGADFARRALEGAGDDPGILVNAALALASFG